MRPIAVTLVFGGPSRERDISAGSLKPWVTYLSDEPGVSLTVVFVDPDLRAWRLPERYAYTNTCADFADDLAPDDRLDDDAFDALLRAQDLVVPVLHGAYGEDGVFQRRLEALGVRYLFSGPHGLAASFDKARTYEVLAAAGFPVPVHRVVGREALDEGVGALNEWVEARLRPATIGGLPRACAVKPARSGSSYGVTLAAPGEKPLADAVRCALEHDDRVLVEELLVGTEFSVLVIDGDDGAPHALAPTEVRARSEVYDTRQKYLHGAGALLDTPMRDAGLVAPVRDAARRAYEALGLRHLARVDGFVVDGRVFVTDVNGISGMGFSSFVFLQTSMIGLSHRQLVRRLVERGAGRPIEDAGAVGERAPAARRVHLLFGGATSERQVSRQSGIFAGLCLLAAGHDVRFHLMGTDHRFTEIGLFLALHHDVEEIEDRIRDPGRRAAIARLADEIREELGLPRDAMEDHLRVAPSADLAGAVAGADAVFLALHGGVGENGTIQAALELLGVPYNGCGPAASALCADKWALLETVAARGLDGVRTPRHERIDRLEMLAMLRRVDDDGWDAELEALRRRLDAPAVVVKPRSDGCSTGVKLLRDGRTMRTFLRAVVELRESVPAGAFSPGSREIVLPRPIPAEWMLEEAIVDDDAAGGDHPPGSPAWFDARRYVELTCAVVERDGRLVCATPTIALSADDELSLEEKFQQGVGTNLLLSCFVDAERVALVRRRIEAIAAAAGIAGFARIDCFLDTRDDSLVLIEVNTLPGMTEATVFYTQVLDAFGWSPARVLGHLAAAQG